MLGRGLAIFLTIYFGAMTFGSALWGKVANVEGLPTALFIAAAGACRRMIVTWPWKLQTGAARDLTPSMHWRAPVFVQRIEDDAGPILVTVEYRIDPQGHGVPSSLVLHDIGLERKRDGAYAWGAFEDVRDEGRIVETFLVRSMRRTQTPARPGDGRGPNDRGKGASLSAGAAECRISGRAAAGTICAPQARAGASARRGRVGVSRERRLGFACLRNAAQKSPKRADRGESLMQIAARRRSDRGIPAAPFDRLGPQMQEDRRPLSFASISRRRAGRKSFQNCSGSTG